MAIIALASAKGSPGVSVTALGMALSWPTRTLLAECDLAGGDALAGFLAGQAEHFGGLANLPVAHGRGRLADDFWGQLIDLHPPAAERLLLPGIGDLADAGGVATMGEQLASLFAGLERADPGYDVIADCGRITPGSVVWPVLERADVIGLVVRGTLPSVTRAHALVTELRARATRLSWSLDGLGVIVVDDGPYSAEVGQTLGLPVFGTLPWDTRTAAKLAFGGDDARASDKLIRAISRLHDPIRDVITRRRPAKAREVAHAA